MPIRRPSWRYGMDQTRCPQCGRMYCEGFWEAGVCTVDMHFCGEPTSDFDESGRCLRVWYEAHRESWWDRNRHSRNQQLLNAGTADEFMLSLIQEVERIAAERQKQLAVIHGMTKGLKAP